MLCYMQAPAGYSSFLMPFETELWVMLLATLLVCSLLMFGLDFVSRRARLAAIGRAHGNGKKEERRKWVGCGLIWLYQALVCLRQCTNLVIGTKTAAVSVVSLVSFHVMHNGCSSPACAAQAGVMQHVHVPDQFIYMYVPSGCDSCSAVPLRSNRTTCTAAHGPQHAAAVSLSFNIVLYKPRIGSSSGGAALCTRPSWLGECGGLTPVN